MKTLITGLLVFLLVSSGSNALAQINFTDQDVPMTPGTIFEYMVESDVAVNVGASGANQSWDFSQVSQFTIQNEEIFTPSDTPWHLWFPAANRATYGPVPFGLDEGPSWRYDQVTASQWTVLGITLYVEELGGEFPFPFEIPLMPLPLDYNDSWGINIYHEVTIDVNDIPYPIPLFDEIRIEITIGGENLCDGWGTVTLPGGNVDALRVYSQVGGYADAVGIWYLFGIPIEVPIGRIYEVPVSKAYSWYTPGYGEVAFALSYPGETDPNFTTASTVRRMNLGDTPETLVLDANPLSPPIQIPALGGSFNWSLGITSTYQTPFFGSIWTTATMPSGFEYFVESVPVILPAQANIFVPLLTQDVPGFAPAGDYIFNVYAGPDPSTPIAQDGFGFSKLAVGTDGIAVGGWHSDGLAQLGDELAGSAAENITAPSEFVLSTAYPNPFNPTTSLTLTLPEAAHVNVVVYDALGRQAAILAQGSYTAGQHSLVLDGSNLASGVYFVSATVTDQGTQMQKAVLMK